MSNNVIKFRKSKSPKKQLVIEIEEMTFIGLGMTAKRRKMVSTCELSLADIEEQAAIVLDEMWELQDEDGNVIRDDD